MRLRAFQRQGGQDCSKQRRREATGTACKAFAYQRRAIEQGSVQHGQGLCRKLKTGPEKWCKVRPREI